MKRKRLAGSIVTIISTAILVLDFLIPEGFSSARVDFSLFLLKQMKYEFFLVLIAGLLLVVPIRVWRIVWSKLRQPFEFLSLRFGITQHLWGFGLVAMVFPFVIYVFLLSAELKNVFKARLYFYDKLLYSSYKSELLRKATHFEMSGLFGEADLVYQRILKCYPGNWYIEGRRNHLRSKLQYAQACFERGLNIEKRMGLGRFSILLMAESIRVDPSNQDVLGEVEARYKKLTEGVRVIETFWKAYKSEDGSTLLEIYDKWGWFLFEEGIRQHIRAKSLGRKKESTVQQVRVLLKNSTKQQFEESIISSWEMDFLSRILSRAKSKTKG